jgi:hypothetical protein
MKRKKVLVNNKSIRPVTIKQAKNASTPSDDRFMIDGHEVTNVSSTKIYKTKIKMAYRIL